MDRYEVFKVIDGERDYQKARWGEKLGEGVYKDIPHEVGEFLVYMQHYLTVAFEDAATRSGYEAALESLRKVVTLGVACFEQHGVPNRSSEWVTNGHDFSETLV